jgi:hypothetical protein
MPIANGLNTSHNLVLMFSPKRKLFGLMKNCQKNQLPSLIGHIPPFYFVEVMTKGTSFGIRGESCLTSDDSTSFFMKSTDGGLHVDTNTRKVKHMPFVWWPEVTY